MHLVALGDALGGKASAVQSNAAGAIAVETDLVKSLSPAVWPAATRTPMINLLAEETKVLADLKKLAAESATDVTTTVTLQSDAAAASSAAQAVRLSLGLAAAPTGDGALGVL
jgi:hypothetical protein